MSSKLADFVVELERSMEMIQPENEGVVISAKRFKTMVRMIALAAKQNAKALEPLAQEFFT